MPRSTSPSGALVAARYQLVRELRVESETVDLEAIDTVLDRPVVVQLLRPELVDDTDAVKRFWQLARAAARQKAVAGNRVLDAGTDRASGQLFVVRELAPPPPSAGDPRPPLPSAPAALATASALAELRSRLQASPRWLMLGGGLVLLMLVAAALRPGVEGWLAWVNEPFARSTPSFGLGPAVPASGAQPGQSTATPAAPPPTVAPAVRSAPPAGAQATPVPTRATTPTTTTTGQSRRIVNTDGRGVALRTAPGGDRQPGKGYDEGVTVQALEQNGEWTHIRGADGREGWVLTVTLAP